MRHAVILAGGSGTRLWPASRRARPKQLLPLGPGGTSLLAAAVRRGRAMAGDRVSIVTAADQVAATRQNLAEHGLGDTAIIAEPVARNTAAAIANATALIAQRDPEASLVVLPADHHVVDEAGLVRIFELAFEAVEARDVIATVGVTPTRADTGFGYLEVAEAVLNTVVPVLCFVEKPNRETAETYLAAGRYLWNGGMFVFTARRMLVELDARLPTTGKAVRAIAAGADAAALYATLPSISIDHAVMEKASDVVTVPASVGWDDIGSWAALPALFGVDDAHNTAAGATALVIDGRNNVLVSDDATLIATVGLSDVIVVKSGDAILVIKKDQAQDVRKIVDALSARGLERYQ